MVNEKHKNLTSSFRVSHPNGDCVKGFDDAQCAREDAAERTARAGDLGLDVEYVAGKRQPA